MRTMLCFGVGLLMCSGLFAQVRFAIETGTGITSLNGKVKSVEILLKKSPTSERFQRRMIRFDRRGRITQDLLYERGQNNERIVYKYDGKNHMIQADMQMREGRWRLGTRYKMKNDAAGRPLEEKIYNDRGRRILEMFNEYDSKGRLRKNTRKEYMFSNGDTRSVHYEYNRKGDQIGYSYHSVGDPEEFTIENEKDAKGRVVKQTVFSNGKQVEQEVFRYDDQGNKTELRFTDEDGAERVLELRYTYYN